MIVFMKCVAEAIVEHGIRGLAAMVPGGEFAFNVAKDALGKYRQKRKAAELRLEFQELAQANYERARQAAHQVAEEIAPKDVDKNDLLTLELYLSQIPGAIRQSLKRPEDPPGTTVPATFTLNSPHDVLKLLPPRPVQFRPGDPLPEKADWMLIEPLGVGGFGEVWRAQHAKLTSLTGAVKFCRRLQARDRDLLHEGHVLNHVMKGGHFPGIVPLIDVHLEGDTPWLMFEYVGGGDLADVIYEWQTLPTNERLEKATTALRELADTVGRFHRLNPAVVHRDLKPANILRDKSSGKLRITDFGIGGVSARAVLEEETRGAMTQGGKLLSCLYGAYTPIYASPQQRDGSDPDPRDDVHALGIIGYQMITGQLNRGAGPDFADDLRDAGVGEDLITLLGRCVAQKAERRPTNAGELAEQLVPRRTGGTWGQKALDWLLRVAEGPVQISAVKAALGHPNTFQHVLAGLRDAGLVETYGKRNAPFYWPVRRPLPPGWSAETAPTPTRKQLFAWANAGTPYTGGALELPDKTLAACRKSLPGLAFSTGPGGFVR